MTTEQSITCVADLIKIADSMREKFGVNGLWWRGQSLATWEITPWIFREERGKFDESTMIKRFMQRAASRYPDCPPVDDIASWFFLMQHYGLPTRLLD